MVPHYSKVHNRFKLNGIHYNFNTLKQIAYNFIKEGELFEKSIGNFLLDWLDANDFITVKTSGSTGQPKSIKLKKQAMVNSAIATGNFFKLQPGDLALQCLPCSYIAGKMMFVRAIILGLELDYIQPKSHLSFNTKKGYSFCAMVPMQLEYNSNALANIKTLIIGGSKLSQSLTNTIKNLPNTIYETYGMTETATHVALKKTRTKASKADAYFKALPNVSFKQDNRDCLIIDTPTILDAPILTNDVVELKSKTEFKWLGRYDNVINSGGIKLFPEQIEEKLQSIIKERFFIASQAHSTLSEALILVIENPSEDNENLLKRIKAVKALDKFEVPKQVYSIPKFLETASGKVQRQKTLKAVFN